MKTNIVLVVRTVTHGTCFRRGFALPRVSDPQAPGLYCAQIFVKQVADLFTFPLRLHTKQDVRRGTSFSDPCGSALGLLFLL